MADDELDELYWVKPEDFTAVRTRLARAAKERGDAETAKEISSSRKPTTAAWVANRLAISHTQTRQRLTELRERLRAAHAAMDGERIRELSAEQRKLVDQLALAAFDAADVSDPSAALRDDVTGTLQAAIADPDVIARLGRLAKAERWSGFGEFGFAATDERDEDDPDEREDDREAARRELKTAKDAVTAAERAKSEADAELSERQADVAAARRRRDEAERALTDARAQLKRLGN